MDVTNHNIRASIISSDLPSSNALKPEVAHAAEDIEKEVVKEQPGDLKSLSESEESEKLKNDLEKKEEENKKKKKNANHSSDEEDDELEDKQKPFRTGFNLDVSG